MGLYAGEYGIYICVAILKNHYETKNFDQPRFTLVVDNDNSSIEALCL